jgi:hypothetical protein
VNTTNYCTILHNQNSRQTRTITTPLTDTMPSPEATNVGATRLGWSSDDDEDDFFGQDDENASGGDWDETFDIGDGVEDLDIAQEQGNGENDGAENENEAEAGFVVVTEDEEKEDEDTMSPADAVDEPEVSSETPAIMESAVTLPPRALMATSSDRPPLPSTSEKVPRTPSGFDEDVTVHPMPISRTPGTPFGELDDADEKFEEIVRQRNKVSAN